MSAGAPNDFADPHRSGASEPLPWVERSDGVTITVRVTPRGGKDAIDGMMRLSDGRSVLKVRVRVAPEDGAANRAVEKVVARFLDVPVSRVGIAGGATSRLKQVKVDGEPRELMETLRANLCNG